MLIKGTYMYMSWLLGFWGPQFQIWRSISNSLLFYARRSCCPRAWPPNPPRKVRAIILGDSLTKYLQENFSSEFVDVEVITRRGTTISRLTDYIRHSPSIRNCDKVLDIVAVHVGTNDLPWGFLHSNVREFWRLIITLWEILPTSKVVMSGILPRQDCTSFDISRVHYNIQFGIVCAQLKCNFFDFSEDFHPWNYVKEMLRLFQS